MLSLPSTQFDMVATVWYYWVVTSGNEINSNARQSCHPDVTIRQDAGRF
jgi:hypothetical protein